MPDPPTCSHVAVAFSTSPCCPEPVPRETSGIGRPAGPMGTVGITPAAETAIITEKNAPSIDAPTQRCLPTQRTGGGDGRESSFQYIKNRRTGGGGDGEVRFSQTRGERVESKPVGMNIPVDHLRNIHEYAPGYHTSSLGSALRYGLSDRSQGLTGYRKHGPDGRVITPGCVESAHPGVPVATLLGSPSLRCGASCTYSFFPYNVTDAREHTRRRRLAPAPRSRRDPAPRSRPRARRPVASPRPRSRGENNFSMQMCTMAVSTMGQCSNALADFITGNDLLMERLASSSV